MTSSPCGCSSVEPYIRLETVLHDVGDLVGERRVVVHDGRVGQREQRRVPVGVLQTLTGQRRPTGGGADQEAAGELVGHRPDRVGGALEPEHRVEDVERDHRLAVRGVRRSRGRGGRHAAGLGDALVQHLPLGRLLPGQQQLAVDRLVELAGRVVDLRRAEHRVHAEGAVLVGGDRHDPRPISSSFIRSLSSRTNAIVVAIFCLPEPCFSSSYIASPGSVERRGFDPSHRYAATQLAAPVAEVLELRRALARVVERRRAVELVVLVDLLVGDRQLEPVAERLEGRGVQLLHLVGGVLALERVDRPALDGVGQDHRRLADVLATRRRRRRTPCGSRGHRAAAARCRGRSCPRPSCAAVRRRRRSARGCRRRSPPSRSGTARRASCSSG